MKKRICVVLRWIAAALMSLLLFVSCCSFTCASGNFNASLAPGGAAGCSLKLSTTLRTLFLPLFPNEQERGAPQTHVPPSSMQYALSITNSVHKKNLRRLVLPHDIARFLFQDSQYRAS